MTDATADFFGRLDRREREPILANASGTVRFDLASDDGIEHWLLRIDKGDVSVTRRRTASDCVVRTDRPLFDAMATGEVNAMAAVLRGAVNVEGDFELLVLIQRLFPGPPSSQRRLERTGAGHGR